MNKAILEILNQCENEALVANAKEELANLEALLPELTNCIEVINNIVRMDENYPQSHEERQEAINNVEGARGAFYVANRAIVDGLKAKLKVTKKFHKKSAE